MRASSMASPARPHALAMLLAALCCRACVSSAAHLRGAGVTAGVGRALRAAHLGQGRGFIATTRRPSQEQPATWGLGVAQLSRAAGFVVTNPIEAHAYSSFFCGHTDGTFVQVGSGDGRAESSPTRALEAGASWRGLMIEGNHATFEKLKRNRPGNVLVRAAVCDQLRTVHYVTAGTARGHGVKELMTPGFLARHHPDLASYKEAPSSSDSTSMYAALGSDERSADIVSTTCVPLQPVLQMAGFPHYDWMHLSIAGAELAVLSAVDFGQVAVDVVSVEADGTDAARELDVIALLLRRDFVYMHKAAGADWFVRRGSVASSCRTQQPAAAAAAAAGQQQQEEAGEEQEGAAVAPISLTAAVLQAIEVQAADVRVADDTAESASSAAGASSGSETAEAGSGKAIGDTWAQRAVLSERPDGDGNFPNGNDSGAADLGAQIIYAKSLPGGGAGSSSAGSSIGEALVEATAAALHLGRNWKAGGVRNGVTVREGGLAGAGRPRALLRQL